MLGKRGGESVLGPAATAGLAVGGGRVGGVVVAAKSRGSAAPCVSGEIATV